MQTPVALLIYRRPDLTTRVFNAIRAERPTTLLIVADGPRADAERPLCDATREIVARIDWPCDVRREYADRNMGCRRRVATGLDWVFGQVEEAIILEDDCVPHPDFFPFCEALLARYRDDMRIGHIGGTDPNRGAARGDGSYYFSRYPSIWGWATWRRCWREYDVSLAAWPALKAAGGHYALFASIEEADHFAGMWDEIVAGTLDTWDAQWFFARLTHNTLAIAPNGNLVTNLGFNAVATHTRDTRHPFANLPTTGMQFPMRHPAKVAADDEADRRRVEAEFLGRPAPLAAWGHRLRNRHFYGGLLRRVPIMGALWGSWRARRDKA